MLDHLLEPADHSKDDYIREQVEERSDEIATIIEQSDLPDWLIECINWDEVEAKLWDDIEEEMKNEMESQAVERWEAKQESQRY